MVREFKQIFDIDNTGLEELTFEQVIAGSDKAGQTPFQFLTDTVASNTRTGVITNELGVELSPMKKARAEFKGLIPLDKAPDTNIGELMAKVTGLSGEMNKDGPSGHSLS